jgi:hypothetical protein
MNVVKQLISRNPRIYRFLAAYTPLFLCGVIMANAGGQSENLYLNQFNDDFINRTASDASVAFAFIWVPCSFFINAGLLYAGEKCGRAFASKIPLISAILIHATSFYYFNNPIEVLTPYWSIEYTSLQLRAQLHQLQITTITSLIALHLIAIILIVAGPKPFSQDQESGSSLDDPGMIEKQ